MLTRELIGTVLVSLVFVVAVFVFFRVKQRRAAQEEMLPMPLAGTSGQELFSCLYVASVFGARPLERVWAHGLGIRGKAEIHRTSEGLSILRQGESSFTVPFSALIGLDRAGATIDRGVERDGLAQLRWLLGDQEIVTSLRITQNQEANFLRLQEAVRESK